MDKYFDKFPTISYNNTQIIDITKRVGIIEKDYNNPYIYFPYEIKNNERADNVSYEIYQDQFKSWVLYLSNKITDPYYEWYLTDLEFSNFLESKYGSLVNAYEKIMFYRNDWINSEDINISRFDALTPKLKNYWQPNYINTTISSYTRKKIDWSVNTNRIVRYTVSNTNFITNEQCKIVFDNRNIGQGQILNTANNKIYIQHTSGVTVSNSTVLITGSSYIYGNESKINTAFTNSSLVVENLAPEEEVYWKPITYFDYETERNEYNKTLKIMDPSFTANLVNDFRILIAQ